MKSTVLVYKLFAVMAFVDTLYIIMVFSMRLTALACNEDPGEHCLRIHYTYYVAYIWISDYLTSCLALFNVLLEIFVTLQRLFMLSNHMPTMQNITKVKLISLVIFVISFSVYTPVLFMKHVVLKPEQNLDLEIEQYELVKTRFGKSKAATIIMNSLIFVLIFLYSWALLVLNIVAVLRFRQYIQKPRADFRSTRSKFN
jgi:hypothetical protein